MRRPGLQQAGDSVPRHDEFLRTAEEDLGAYYNGSVGELWSGRHLSSDGSTTSSCSSSCCYSCCCSNCCCCGCCCCRYCILSRVLLYSPGRPGTQQVSQDDLNDPPASSFSLSILNAKIHMCPSIS